VDPDLRTALLVLGVVFCALFGFATLYVLADSGLHLRTFGDILGLGLYAASLGIVGMIAAGLIGAIRNPPDE
jgi:hypothetical protein